MTCTCNCSCKNEPHYDEESEDFVVGFTWDDDDDFDSDFADDLRLELRDEVAEYILDTFDEAYEQGYSAGLIDGARNALDTQKYANTTPSAGTTWTSPIPSLHTSSTFISPDFDSPVSGLEDRLLDIEVFQESLSLQLADLAVLVADLRRLIHT